MVYTIEQTQIAADHDRPSANKSTSICVPSYLPINCEGMTIHVYTTQKQYSSFLNFNAGFDNVVVSA